jgi:hypothetical protein
MYCHSEILQLALSLCLLHLSKCVFLRGACKKAVELGYWLLDLCGLWQLAKDRL